jgi:para-nitrobenzyl esterase
MDERVHTIPRPRLPLVAATAKLKVATKPGLLHGAWEDGVQVFRGVPYSEPPIGDRRFRSPVSMRWEGERDATRSGPASYQINAGNREKVMSEVGAMDPGLPGDPLWPAYAAETYAQNNASEDCLYVDIWTPSTEHAEKLPVYVYYHGGANTASSGHFRLENAANLAREENIIVVRPTYRMGALGCVHFGLVTDRFPEAINLGLQDQIAALKWVYDNIEAFSGDKENITVGGESAGATAVSHLLAYPGTQSLIRRAIIQSFSPFHVWSTQVKEDGVAIAQLYLQILGIVDTDKLLTLDPNKFLAVHSMLQRYFPADKNCAWRPVGPVVDGDFVPQLPVQFLSGQTYPRPDFELMIGFAKDEWQYFRGHSKTAQHGTKDDVIAILAQVFGQEGAKKMYRTYRELYPDHAEPGYTLGDVMSFEFFKYPSLTIARNFASQGIPTHVFQFSYDLPGYGGYLRAAHTGDTAIVFRNLTEDVLRMWPGYDGADRSELRRIATEFGSMYGSFIRSGNPGSAWAKFDVENGAIMWLGHAVELKQNLLDKEWDTVSHAGIEDVKVLEKRLSTNSRASLKVRSRAFATAR